jgi:outer membrane protein assembly factor BamB
MDEGIRMYSCTKPLTIWEVFMRIKYASLLFSLTALFYFGLQPTIVLMADSSYIGTNWDPDPIPNITPKWSISTDVPKEDWRISEGTIATGDGKVFVIQKGQLLAVNTKTGKKAWAFGSKLVSPLLYNDGIVYVSSNDGALFAVNTTNGKKKWGTTFKTSAIQYLQTNNDRLFVVNGDIQAFELKTGKGLWTDDYPDLFGGPLSFAGGKIVVSTMISGAYSYYALMGFDEKTGRLSWTVSNASKPLLVNNNTFVVQRTSNLLSQLVLTTLDTIDTSTGEIVKTVEYNPTGIDPIEAKELLSFPGSEAWIDSDTIYMRISGVVYGYPLDADPIKTIRDSYRPEGGYQNHWIGGPSAGRLLFTDGINITGVKLVNKSTVFYGSMGNPIARFDIIGEGMYVSLTDGKVVAVDLINAKRLFQLQMPSRVFGPTVQADGMIIVQSKGKISAFPEPVQFQ